MTQQESFSLDSLFQAGLSAHRKGDLSKALTLYFRVLQKSPNRADALNNLGVALRQSGKYGAAEICYRRLQNEAPPTAGLCVNLGNVLRDQGRLTDSETAYRDALRLDSNSPSALHGLGLVLRDLERMDESIDAFDQALIVAEPDNVDQYNWDRSLSLLRAGRYREGFKAYESRWCQAGQQKHNSSAPEWDGSPLKGRRLLLYGEQGFGDVLQFARFVPLIVNSGGSVLLSVRNDLVTLLNDQFEGVEGVFSRNDNMPEHDVVLPLLSVPRALGLDRKDLRNTSYMSVPDSKGHADFRSAGAKFKVALAWAGSPTQKNDRNRSFPLAAMAPLLSHPGVQFFSIQKGSAIEQLNSSGLGFAITDLSDQLGDFADTARFLGDMDLVISCDSAVVHLAGALGVPVWVALSVFHDWRYGVSGDLSHWYESSRVFKQSEPGNWKDVFARISGALATFIR